jgi:hypothetical protein
LEGLSLIRNAKEFITKAADMGVPSHKKYKTTPTVEKPAEKVATAK